MFFFLDYYRDLPYASFYDGNFIAILIKESRRINALNNHFSDSFVEATELTKINSDLICKFHKAVKNKRTERKDIEDFVSNYQSLPLSKVVRFLKNTDFVFSTIKETSYSIIVFKNKPELHYYDKYSNAADNLAKYICDKEQQKNISEILHLSELAFSEIKVVESVKDYLPLIYRSNLLRYQKDFNVIYSQFNKQVSPTKGLSKKVGDIRANQLISCLERCKELKNNISRILAKETSSYSDFVDCISKCEILNRRMVNYLERYLHVDYISKNTTDNLNRNNLSFYRGITNYSYNSLPKIFREERNLKTENDNFYEFTNRFPNDFKNKTTFESLVLMQHYGCSTRLLDLTTNPLVALFMACYPDFSPKDSEDEIGEILVFFPAYDEKNKENEVKYSSSLKVSILSNITMLDYHEKILLKRVLGVKHLLKPIQDYFEGKTDHVSFPKMRVKFAEDLEGAKKAYLHLIELVKKDTKLSDVSFDLSILNRDYFVKPPLSNDRIRAQSGCFILVGLNSEYADLNFKNSRNDSDFCRVLVINKNNILNELKQLNIHEGTLMPDLESVADYIYNIKDSKN